MAIAIALPVVLLAAYLIGQLARLAAARPGAADASTTTIVLSVLGISVGMLIAGLVSTTCGRGARW